MALHPFDTYKHYIPEKQLTIMTQLSKAVRVGQIAVSDLLNVVEDESVVIITDESGTVENNAIIDAIFGLVVAYDAICNVLTIEDRHDGGEALPQIAEEAMKTADVVVGLTMTTTASIVHHPLPTRLLEEDKIRGINMTKRPYDTLTSEAVLDADYEKMLTIGSRWQDLLHNGETLSITSELGTNLTASIAGKWSWNDKFAHEKGQLTAINWGKVLQGPVVGTTEGTAVIDGPVLDHGWPSSPITVEIENGAVVEIQGDDPIVGELTEKIKEIENADNIAEISFGLNDRATTKDVNIWKKGLGRTQIAIGDGLAYGQSIESPIHIDMVMNTATVEIDGTAIIKDGTPVGDFD